MRYVSLEKAQPGMRLAYGIYDSYGRTLLGYHCELTQGYIDKLCEYGFDGVYITDALSEGIQVESVITPQLRTEGMACIRELDIDGCHDIARQIVEEILSKGEMSLDLTDLRSYDDYTYAHSVNVAVVSCIIGIGLELDETELAHLVMAGLLHDMGKLSIPPEILNKPGRLTQEEYQIMKTHATLSYELLSERWDIPSRVKRAMLHHHENVDGSGYPLGISGSEQFLFTKILHVADVYDALVSKRPYKNPYSPYEATEYLMGAGGIMFEQRIVETLLEFVPLFPKGTEVKLSDGRVGIIYENGGVHNLRPVMRLLDGAMLDLMDSSNLNVTVLTAEGDEKFSLEESEKERKEMLKPITRYRIMIVDDMKTNLQTLREILENLYEVILIKSGRQALTYLKKNPYPDLILMDIDMPEMNGIEAAKEIQELTGKTVPILFTTALSDPETVMACRSLDAAGYIVRPYKPVYIKAEIKRILSRRGEFE